MQVQLSTSAQSSPSFFLDFPLAVAQIRLWTTTIFGVEMGKALVDGASVSAASAVHGGLCENVE